MLFNSYELLIICCFLVICSYVFNVVSRMLRVPSVLLLLGLGMCLKWASKEMHYEMPDMTAPLELFGIVGLILIVLEGALDLKLGRENSRTIRDSLLIALALIVGSTFSIAAVMHFWLDAPFYEAMVNALPLAVVSSAIAIPSVERLTANKKQFITYESTFSDIIGIMLFDYLINPTAFSLAGVAVFSGKLALIILISIACSLLLMYLIHKIESHVKFFLLLAVLILVYSLSKTLHLSPLLLILVFGLLLNNVMSIVQFNIRRFINPRRYHHELHSLKLITQESAFLIRTFFFVLFGFSVNLNELMNWQVIQVGSLIVALLLLIRFLCLRFITHSNMFPELLIAPRGLITILLFYSIPAQLMLPQFTRGIVLYVIIVSSLLMTLGLMFSQEAKDEHLIDQIEESL